MLNIHTCSACGMDLFASTVLVMDGEPVQLARDVVGGAGVDVPWVGVVVVVVVVAATAVVAVRGVGGVG